MKRLFLAACLALPTILVAADTAQAGIFGRRWERRRAELYGSLNRQLSGQVQNNVARAAAGVQKNLDARFAEESVKIEQQMNEQLAAIRQQAAETVAAESKRLQDETAANIARLREETASIVAAETRKLQETLKTDLARIRDENNKQIADALARIDTKLAEAQKQISDQVARLPDNVQSEARKLKDQIMPELSAQVKAEVKAEVASLSPGTQSPAQPTDEKKSTPPAQDAVIENKPAEEKADEANE